MSAIPFIWYCLLIVALCLYVLLDGFDLGVGILFPFAPSEESRDLMMNSIAPFWDGNETWLVLSGGGLLAAFPLAYSILMPAFYMPVILMLFGLIFRGVAFEFRFKATKGRSIWSYAFHFGSVLAAFMQGMILGAYVTGVQVAGRSFAGRPFDWISAYSFMTGVALVFGYALLGSTWLVMKTEGVTRDWARKCASYVLAYVALFLGIVSISLPIMNGTIRKLWFSLPDFYYFAPMPLATAVLVLAVWRQLYRGSDTSPFFMSLGIFLLGYIGWAISLWPWLVPFAVTYRQAAAAHSSQMFLLAGTIFVLPTILAYFAYCYYVFRGKVAQAGYY
ncbi:MAG: cytochrome d ubiquinol oxidase subunit II [Deltaproteobacteria bacterium]|jgi:cytochrome d ubiquinol oxidase subunit II|nr:cytochrome d ubiquinol oxidase subunit II [Deltaproteobacteria bacterium]MDA8305381.1 cytochrome d ubiquinol oxidase subunit II [Deltaproteobacteria bacterium]